MAKVDLKLCDRRDHLVYGLFARAFRLPQVRLIQVAKL
jgi:hypothetical protein